MRIRRITVGVLLFLTLLFIFDMKFNQGSWIGDRSNINIEIKPVEENGGAEKVVEFNYPAERFDSLKLEGSYGKITVERASDANLSVAAQIQLTDEEQSLDDWGITEKIQGGKISYGLSGPSSAAGRVQTTYFVRIPPAMGLEIDQKYMTTSLDNLENNVSLKTQFSTVKVNNLKGSLVVESSFSPLTLLGVSGPVQIKDVYSTISLALEKMSEGYDFDLELDYGTLSYDLPLEEEKTGPQIKVKGVYGQGAYPVRIKSKFSSLNLAFQE